MGWFRTIGGLVVTGTVTLSLFGGGPLLAVLGVGVPTFTLDQLVEREAVYWEQGVGGDDFEGVELELAPDPVPIEPDVEVADEARDDASAGGQQTGSGSASAAVATTRDGPAAREGGARSTRTRTRGKKKGRRCEPEPIPEITKTSKANWTVRRSLIKSYTKNFGRINALGWSKSHKHDPVIPDGMKIGGVRCNNDLHRAGIRSGDILHTVNGHRVTNLVQALLVYTKVRKDRTLRVNLTRRGERKTLTYRIRE